MRLALSLIAFIAAYKLGRHDRKTARMAVFVRGYTLGAERALDDALDDYAVDEMAAVVPDEFYAAQVDAARQGRQ